MRSFSALVAVWLVACGPGIPEENIPRTLGGRSRLGSFVSSSSYEAFVRAERAVALGELPEAVYQYRVALAGASEDPYVLARLASVLEQLGQHDDADDAVERALRLDPESEAGWIVKAEIAHQRHDVNAAIAAFEHAAAAPVDSTEATLRLASLLYETNDAPRAEALLDALIERAGEGALPAARARLRMALERNDLAGIVECATNIQRTYPMTSAEVRGIARRLLQGDQSERAADLLATVPESADDGRLRVDALLAARRFGAVEAYLATHSLSRIGSATEIAQIYLTANVPQRALELAEGTLLTQSDPRTHWVAAQAAYALNLFDRTAQHVANIERGASDYVASRLLLSRALVGHGMRAEAVEVLSRLSADVPDDERVTAELSALRQTQ